MKRILFSAAMLLLPIAAHAAPVTAAPVTAPKQAICETVIVILEDGSAVEGTLCYTVSGRV